ncbi:MAG: MlaC/ttg2D family ABC transporter substrate-binding protein [Bradyrhizobium sp.]
MLTPTLAAPAVAQPAAQDTSGACAFIDKLADQAFATLKTSGGDVTPAQRAKFRSMLTRDFAVKSIGDRLIRRWWPTITPAQYSAYTAAFPDYIINTYADRLSDYANADLKVTRVAAAPGNVGWQVFTVVTKPGAHPANAVWSVVRAGSDFQVTNLTVGGVNLAVTQGADFDSYVQSHGFDALIAFMKARQS